MISRRFITPILAAVLIVTVAPYALASGAKSGAKPVATVGDGAITEAELNEALGSRLMRLRTEEYNIRRATLDQLVTERLLRGEAARRGITVEELTRTEVDEKVTAPTREEVEPFYEATRERYAGASKDEAIEQILTGMRRQRSAKRMTEFLNQLRAATPIQVLIDAPRATVAANGPSRGSADAAVTIVEYADYECAYCGRAAATLKKIESQYGDRVRIVYRDYPLASHRGAPRAAEAAHCAGDQGKYWEMHDRLFSKGGAIGEADIQKYAGEISLDLPAFRECLASSKHTATWKAAHAEGASVGVQSTPTFFVNGRMLTGAASLEAFSAMIDEELERQSAKRVSVKAAPAPAASR